MKDLKSRWLVAAGELWTFVSDQGDQSRPVTRHRAGYGDFVRAYFEHLDIPWWKRMWWRSEWTEVEAIMRSLLNERSPVQWLD